MNGESPAGIAFMETIDESFLDLEPDVFVARIPEGLVIGLCCDGETYILRRPGLH